jgi:hypothetical protein
MLCARGTFNAEFAGNCLPCAEGRISEIEGATECIDCGPGTTSNAERSACIPCAAGTFNSMSRSICLPCAEGFTSDEGATECFPAPQIPAITFWGILILGLILSVIGGVYLNRREKVLQ